MRLDVEARTDLLDDRHGRRATLIISLPVRLSEHALDSQREDDRIFRTFVQVWRWRFELGNRPVGKVFSAGQRRQLRLSSHPLLIVRFSASSHERSPTFGGHPEGFGQDLPLGRVSPAAGRRALRSAIGGVSGQAAQQKADMPPGMQERPGEPTRGANLSAPRAIGPGQKRTLDKCGVRFGRNTPVAGAGFIEACASFERTPGFLRAP